MNGTLQLKLRGNKHYTVIGGAYSLRMAGTVGVKMARELKLPCDVDIPTADFNTPNPYTLDDGLERAVRAILEGKPVYVGCMAGRGRTGLFLAVLAKAFGEESPVEYVREHYYPHAVENDIQYEFVKDYDIPPMVNKMLFWARIRSYFRIRNSLTNLDCLG